MKTSTSRTNQQNKALHKLFEELADELLAAGVDMKVVVSIMRNYAVPATKDNVKELVWRPLQEAVTGKKSTTELTTSEVDKVFEQLQGVLNSDERTRELNIVFPSMKVLLQNNH